MYEYDYISAREEILAIQQHEEHLRKLMQESIGNEVIQENGQRKIGGPPPSKILHTLFNGVLTKKIVSL
jgi:hypothetical protein